MHLSGISVTNANVQDWNFFFLLRQSSKKQQVWGLQFLSSLMGGSRQEVQNEQVAVTELIIMDQWLIIMDLDRCHHVICASNDFYNCSSGPDSCCQYMSYRSSGAVAFLQSLLGPQTCKCCLVFMCLYQSWCCRLKLFGLTWTWSCIDDICTLVLQNWFPYQSIHLYSWRSVAAVLLMRWWSRFFTSSHMILKVEVNSVDTACLITIEKS